MRMTWLCGPLLAVLGGSLAACAPAGEAGAPGPASPIVSPSAGASLAESGTAAAALASAPDCGSGDQVVVEHPDWPLAGPAEPAFLPVIQSSLISVGPSRFLYNVLDGTYRQLAAPELPSRVDFYALARDAETPTASVEASYLSSGLGRGLYRAAVDFDCVGEWGAEIALETPDGTTVRERLRFEVQPAGSTPAIGAPAPRSESLTASSLEEVRRISTDPNPYVAGYLSTVAEAVTSGRPSIIFFATPAFCQTGFCGPTIELVKSVARDYEGRVAYVNVEPYELHETPNGLRPTLDAEGHLQPVAAAREYGIPIEPYLFVVDATGHVFAAFEGVVGADELRAVLEDVLAESA
jgi:hypothetical protein